MFTIRFENISEEVFQTRYKLMYILFGSVTLLFFLNFFTPFDLKSAFNVPVGKFHMILSGYVLPFIAVSFFSQFILKSILQKRRAKMRFHMYTVFVEFILLDIGFSTWYAMHNVVYDRSFASILLSVIPETLIFLSFLNIALYVFLQHCKPILSPVKSEHTDYKKSVPAIELTDEKNRSILTMEVRSLLYIKSADNYVDVCFIKKGVIENRLIRTTIKRLEKKIEGNAIVRCHRSYMVNLLAVKGFSQAGGKLKMYLDDSRNLVIPVSGKYAPTTLESLRIAGGLTACGEN